MRDEVVHNNGKEQDIVLINEKSILGGKKEQSEKVKLERPLTSVTGHE